MSSSLEETAIYRSDSWKVRNRRITPEKLERNADERLRKTFWTDVGGRTLLYAGLVASVLTISSIGGVCTEPQGRTYNASEYIVTPGPGPITIPVEYSENQ